MESIRERFARRMMLLISAGMTIDEALREVASDDSFGDYVDRLIDTVKDNSIKKAAEEG